MLPQIQNQQKPAEQIEEHLSLRHFVLQNWSKFPHPQSASPAGKGRTSHAKYCNGIFCHFQTTEGEIIHGQYKATFERTLAKSAALLERLVNCIVEVPHPVDFPSFERSDYFPSHVPPKPEHKKPVLCKCQFKRECKVHLKVIPEPDDPKYEPQIRAVPVKPATVPDPEPPRILPNPEYKNPDGLKPIIGFQKPKLHAIPQLSSCPMELHALEVDKKDAPTSVGLMSVEAVTIHWDVVCACLKALVLVCDAVMVICTREESAKIQTLLHDERAKGTLGECKVVCHVQQVRSVGKEEAQVLATDIKQAYASVSTAAAAQATFGKAFRKATSCLAVRVDFQHHKDMKLDDNKAVAPGKPPLEDSAIAFVPIRLVPEPFIPPQLEPLLPFHTQQNTLPPPPKVRPLLPMPRPADFMPRQPMADQIDMPKTIDDLPEEYSSLSFSSGSDATAVWRVPDPEWEEPELAELEKVKVPEFKPTDMAALRKLSPCLRLRKLLKRSPAAFEEEPVFVPNEEFLKELVVAIHDPPAPIDFTPQPFLPPPNALVPWRLARPVRSSDRMLPRQELGRSPVFVIDGSGSMAGAKWELVLSCAQELFWEEDGGSTRFPGGIEVVITAGGGVHVWGGGLVRRESGAATASEWLRGWTPGGAAEMTGALREALTAGRTSAVLLITDSHPNKREGLLHLARSETQGREGQGRPIHVAAVEMTVPGLRFWERIASISGGRCRHVPLHVVGCPLADGKSPPDSQQSHLQDHAARKGKAAEAVAAKKQWVGALQETFARDGWVDSAAKLDVNGTGRVDPRELVEQLDAIKQWGGGNGSTVKAGLAEARRAQPRMEHEDVDIVDFVGAIAAGEWEGFNLRTRFYAVDPRAHEVLRAHFADLRRAFEERRAGAGGLPAVEIVRAMLTLQEQLPAPVPEKELFKIAALAVRDCRGRVDIQQLLNLFHPDRSVREKRIQQLAHQRKEEKQHKLTPACRCVELGREHPDAVVHFLTGAEEEERERYYEERASEAKQMEDELRRAHDEAEEHKREALELEHNQAARELAEAHARDVAQAKAQQAEALERERERFFLLNCKALRQRNLMRVEKRRVDCLVLNTTRTLPDPEPGAPQSTLLVSSLLSSPLARKAAESPRPTSILEHNSKAMQAAVMDASGEARQSGREETSGTHDAVHALHDITTCDQCMMAEPFLLEPHQTEVEVLPRILVKLTLQQASNRTFLADLRHVLFDAIVKTLAPWIIEEDINILHMTEVDVSAHQKARGAENSTVLELEILLGDPEHPRQRFQQFSDALELGKINELLKKRGYPSTLLHTQRWEHLKLSTTVTSPTEFRVQEDKYHAYEKTWEEYLAKMQEEAQAAALRDKGRFTVHQRLVAAAERKNADRLAVKRTMKLKEFKAEVKRVTAINKERLKRYQALMKSSADSIKAERLARYEQDKAAGEKQYYAEMQRVTENNKLSEQESKALKAYRANLDYLKAEQEVKRQDDNKKRDTLNLLTRATNQHRMQNARKEHQQLKDLLDERWEDAQMRVRVAHDKVSKHVEEANKAVYDAAYEKYRTRWKAELENNERLEWSARRSYDDRSRYVQKENDSRRHQYETEKVMVKLRNDEVQAEYQRKLAAAEQYNKDAVIHAQEYYQETVNLFKTHNENLVKERLEQYEYAVTRWEADNAKTMENALKAYEKHFSKEIAHNNYCEAALKYVADARQEMVYIRKFFNVVKKHLASCISASNQRWSDPDEAARQEMSEFPSDIVAAAEDSFFSWWGVVGDIERLAACRIIKHRADEQRFKDEAARLPESPALDDSTEDEAEPEVKLEGVYECPLYDGAAKKDWHYVTITRISDVCYKWTNRFGVSWTLTRTDNPTVLAVGSECPYYDSHKKAEFTVQNGRVVRVLGPWREPFVKMNTDEDDSASDDATAAAGPGKKQKRGGVSKPFSWVERLAKTPIPPRMEGEECYASMFQASVPHRPLVARTDLSSSPRARRLGGASAAKHLDATEPAVHSAADPRPSHATDPSHNLRRVVINGTPVQASPPAARPGAFLQTTQEGSKENPRPFGSGGARHTLWAVPVGNSGLPPALATVALAAHVEEMDMKRAIERQQQPALALTKANDASEEPAESEGGVDAAKQGEGAKLSAAAKRIDWLHAVIPMHVIIEALVEAYGGYEGHSSEQRLPKRAFMPVEPPHHSPHRHVPDEGAPLPPAAARGVGLPPQLDALALPSITAKRPDRELLK